jgi:hypothetical protein
MTSPTLKALKRNRIPHVWPGTRRVLALPQKSWGGEDLTSEFSISGEYSLRPIQSEMLHEIRETGGLVAAVGVGFGKTLPSFIAGTALGVDHTVLLVPPALVNQTEKEIRRFRPHFNLPYRLTVVSYGMLSTAEGTDLLERLAPDLIVADECHMLRHSTSARTKRVLRYFRKNPETHFVGLSGTLTAKSLKDFAHLIELALRNKSPIPLDYLELESWANCIDVNGAPLRSDFGVVRPLVEAWDKEGGSARVAFRERFRASPGVVATEGQSCGASLYMKLDDSLKAPPLIVAAIKRLEKTWVTPGGEELEDIVALYRHRRHLASGFYMEWDWPNGVVDKVWLRARSEWSINVRRVLHRSVEGRDSPLLVARWADGSECRDIDLIRAWESWSLVKDRPVPPSKIIWMDKFLVDYLFEKAMNSKKPVIIWTQHRAIREALAERGLTAFGPGDAPEEVKKPMSCVMSIPAHGTGKNLQKWSHNILADFPANGAVVEQCLGRSHRPGQQADEVIVEFFLQHKSVEDDVTKALKVCQYIEESTGGKTKLNAATWI